MTTKSIQPSHTSNLARSCTTVDSTAWRWTSPNWQDSQNSRATLDIRWETFITGGTNKADRRTGAGTHVERSNLSTTFTYNPNKDGHIDKYLHQTFPSIFNLVATEFVFRNFFCQASQIGFDPSTNLSFVPLQHAESNQKEKTKRCQ